MPKEAAPKPIGRRGRSMEFSESMALKLHPDMKAHVQRRGRETYRTPQEYIRQLIVEDMEKHGMDGVKSA